MGSLLYVLWSAQKHTVFRRPSVSRHFAVSLASIARTTVSFTMVRTRCAFHLDRGGLSDRTIRVDDAHTLWMQVACPVYHKDLSPLLERATPCDLATIDQKNSSRLKITPLESNRSGADRRQGH